MGQHDGTEKVLRRIEKHVVSGEFYEAQQMYKSVHARFMSQFRYSDALELALKGACAQLKHGQITCGLELGSMYVDTLVMTETAYEEDVFENIFLLFRHFPLFDSSRPLSTDWENDKSKHDKNANINNNNNNNNNICDNTTAIVDVCGVRVKEGMEEAANNKVRLEGCCSIMKAAIRWSVKSGGFKFGDSKLHDLLAYYSWTQSKPKDIAAASRHFVLGTNFRPFAQALEEYMTECFPGEYDLIVARAILQYLVVGNLKDANGIFEHFNSFDPFKAAKLDDGNNERIDEGREEKGEGGRNEKREVGREEGTKRPQVPETALIHFLKFLLLTLERDALSLFNFLRSRYQVSLKRDSSFNNYLDEIAFKFFQVSRPTSGLGGIMGDIMKMFTSDAD